MFQTQAQRVELSRKRIIAVTEKCEKLRVNSMWVKKITQWISITKLLSYGECPIVKKCSINLKATSDKIYAQSMSHDYSQIVGVWTVQREESLFRRVLYGISIENKTNVHCVIGVSGVWSTTPFRKSSYFA